jgi:hypothetical protein
MWRKIVVIFLFVGLFVGTAAAQEKSYSADRFDIDVVVQEDGSLLVTESVTFDFVGGPFSFVFRELPTDLTDGITGIEASVDGRSLSRGDQPGQVEISGSDPVRVEWHLEPTSDSRRTFTLSYQVLGVVRQTDAADILIYQPLPDEFEYSIDQSTVTIAYPAVAEMNGEPRLTAGDGQIQQSDNGLTVIAQTLSANETMVIEMPFAPGSLITTAPAWQQQQAEQRASAPLWITAAVVLFVAGLVAIWFMYRRYRPSPQPSAGTVYEPPSELPPGMAGAINANGAEPSWTHALATLFDLADRGVLKIDEIAEKKWYKSQEFVIKQVEEPAELRPHERGLLALLFETKDGRVEQVKLSELSGRVSSRQWKKYADSLKAEIKAAGFISQRRKMARERLKGVGILLIFISIGWAVAAAFIGNPWATAPAASSFLLGLVGIIAGMALSPLTDEGAAVSAGWKRFADHLKQVSGGKAAVSGPQMFQRFLPYAAGFGLLESWAKWFQKRGWTELPPYFNALSRADDGGVAAFVAMTAATSSSGGSAAGAAGAAGAGAAGGGASGAG